MAEDGFTLSDEDKEELRARLAEQREQRDAFTAQRNVVTETDSPDDAAYDLKKSSEKGIPRMAVAGDREGYKSEDTLAKLERMAKEAPKTRTWLDNPDNYAIARDDVDNLSRIERVLSDTKSFGRSVATAVPAMVGGSISGFGEQLASLQQLNMDYGLGRIPGVDALVEKENEYWAKNPELAKKMNAYGGPAALMKSYGGLGKDIADEWRPDDQGFWGQVGEGLGQVASAVALAIPTRGRSLTTLTFAGMGVDQQAESMRAAGVDPLYNPAKLALGGGITAVSEEVRLNRIMKAVPAKARKAVWKSILGRIAREGAEEGIQEIIEGLGHNALTMTYDEEAQLLDTLAEQGGVAATVGAIFQAGIELAVPGKSRGNLRIREELDRLRNEVEATPNEKALDKLFQLAGSSKLSERSPEAFENYLKGIAYEEGMDSVSLDLRGAAEALEAKGVDAIDVLSQIGMSPEQIAEAMELTGSIDLATSTVLSSPTVKENMDVLRPHIRSSSDTFTPAQREAAKESAEVDLQDIVEAHKAIMEGQFEAENADANITAQLEDRITQTGMYADPQEITANATVISSMVSWLAKVQGRSAQDVFDEQGPAIMGVFGLGDEQVQMGDDVVMQQAQANGFEGTDMEGAQEWEAARAKGLDMSTEGRMTRAKEMGFDTETRLYHGTADEIKQFEAGYGGKVTGAPSAEKAIWLSSNPDASDLFAVRRSDDTLGTPVKSDFSSELDALNTKLQSKNAFIKPRHNAEMFIYASPVEQVLEKSVRAQDADAVIQAQLSKILSPSAMKEFGNELLSLAQQMREAHRGKFINGLAKKHSKLGTNFSAGPNILAVHTRLRNPMIVDQGGKKFREDRFSTLVDRARELGHDGLIVRNTFDPLEMDAVAVFDPSNIRSINAAFDPDHADSANLLNQLIGPKAKTADKAILKTAQKMAKETVKVRVEGKRLKQKRAKYTRQQIWDKTAEMGQPWYQAEDGSWISEVEDGVVVVNEGKGKVSEVIEYPALYEQYPQVGEMRADARDTVTVREETGDRDVPGTKGTFTPSPMIWSPHVRISDQGENSAEYTAVHELTHAIDAIEGRLKSKEPYLLQPTERRAFNAMYRRQWTMAERIATPPWKTEQEAINWFQGGRDLDAPRARYAKDGTYDPMAQIAPPKSAEQQWREADPAAENDPRARRSDRDLELPGERVPQRITDSDGFIMNASATIGETPYVMGRTFLSMKEFLRALPHMNITQRPSEEAISNAIDELRLTPANGTKDSLVSYIKKSADPVDTLARLVASAAVGRGVKVPSPERAKQVVESALGNPVKNQAFLDTPEAYLLDLDTPLGEQSKAHQAALTRLIEQGYPGTSLAYMRGLPTVKHVIEELALLGDNEQHGSRLMRDLISDMREVGIYGGTYTSGGIKADGPPQFSSVIVFDETASIATRDNAGNLMQGTAGNYSPSQNAIRLFEAKNVSTLMHESAHWFLDTLEKINQSDQAPAEITAMLENIRVWHGMPADQSIYDENGVVTPEGRELHEAFAETFEVYLRSGKAPNAKLREAFRFFKQWLTQLYKKVAGNPNLSRANLNPEITDIFDRILGVEDAVDVATSGIKVEAQIMVDQMLESGVLTEREHARAKERLANAIEEVKEEWTAKLFDEAEKRHKAWEKGERRILREEAIRDFDRSDVGRAEGVLGRGEWMGDVVTSSEADTLDQSLSGRAGDQQSDAVTAPAQAVEDRRQQAAVAAFKEAAACTANQTAGIGAMVAGNLLGLGVAGTGAAIVMHATDDEGRARRKEIADQIAFDERLRTDPEFKRAYTNARDAAAKEAMEAEVARETEAERKRVEALYSDVDNMPTDNQFNMNGWAEQAVGVDAGFLDDLIGHEAADDWSAANPESSARGGAQFIESTWFHQMAKHGPQHGADDPHLAEAYETGRDIAQRTGRSEEREVARAYRKLASKDKQKVLLDLREDRRWGTMVAAHFTRDNVEHLERATGKQINHKQAYLAHFLGVDTAVKALRANPEANAAEMFPAAAAANQNVFYKRGNLENPRTVKEMIARQGGNFSSAPALIDHEYLSLEDAAVSDGMVDREVTA